MGFSIQKIFKRKRKATVADEPPIVPGYYVKTPEQVEEELKTSMEQGLSGDDVMERELKYGKNIIAASEGAKWWVILARHTFNFMQAVLLVAAIVSMAVREWPDAGVIIFIILLNTFVGFSQEYRSEKTLEALRKLSSPSSTVVRDGHQTEVPSDCIVPGDIVVLKEGDRVPCDMRLFKVVSLECDEALLTGESMPVEKTIKARDKEDTPLGDRKCAAYMSTTVTKGKGKGIAVATDSIAKVEVNLLAILFLIQKGETKLQIRMAKMGQWLVLGALIAIFLVMITGWAWDTFENVWEDGLVVGISTAVAIIPESLVPVVTLTLTLGVRRLAERHAIIRKLSALESFGNITDICSDKTGTLTQGKMVATGMWVGGEKYSITGLGLTPKGHLERPNGKKVKKFDETIKKAILVAGLCNNSSISPKVLDDGNTEYVAVGSPTEVALVVLAQKLGMKPASLKEKHTYMIEFPFDSAIKRMSMVYRSEEESQNYLYAKGAPEGILSLCTRVHLKEEGVQKLTKKHEAAIKEQNIAMAAEGLRVLALSYKTMPNDFTPEGTKRGDVENDLIFLGLVGINDPPREGVHQSIETCHKAGITVRMVTGDHPVTSFAIAKSIGIVRENMLADEAGEKLTTAAEFDKLGILSFFPLTPDDATLNAMPHLPLVIARCSPTSKVKMIGALHARNRFVAMTGDGVNDAPAIGAAMGKAGSDVTKEASDVVLTGSFSLLLLTQDDNFSTIVVAIEEGRRIFNNIRKFIIHLLAGNISEIIVLVIGIGVGLKPPLLPLQILWLNFITGAPPAMALGVQPSTKELMDQTKRPVGEGLFTIETLIDMTYYGIVMGLVSLGNFLISRRVLEDELPTAQGVTFATLTLCLLFHAYNCVDQRKTLFSFRTARALWLHAAILLGIFSLIVAFFIPPIRTNVFKHNSPSGEGWAFAIGGTIVFMLLCEFYKVVKRYVRKFIKRRRIVNLSDIELEY